MKDMIYFFAGFFIGTVVNAGVIYFGDPAMIWIGSLVAMVIGLGKELYDIKKTGFNWSDFLLTWIGGSLAMFIDLLKL